MQLQLPKKSKKTEKPDQFFVRNSNGAYESQLKKLQERAQKKN